MPRRIALDASPNYTLSVQLDGREYELGFRWSQREDRYYMRIADVRGVVLLHAQPVIVGQRLLQYQSAAGLPPGDLMFLDSRPGQPRTALADLGVSVNLFYLTATEIAALDAESSSEVAGLGGGGEPMGEPL